MKSSPHKKLAVLLTSKALLNSVKNLACRIHDVEKAVSLDNPSTKTPAKSANEARKNSVTGVRGLSTLKISVTSNDFLLRFWKLVRTAPLTSCNEAENLAISAADRDANFVPPSAQDSDLGEILAIVALQYEKPLAIRNLRSFGESSL